VHHGVELEERAHRGDEAPQRGHLPAEAVEIVRRAQRGEAAALEHIHHDQRRPVGADDVGQLAQGDLVPRIGLGSVVHG
jgi:hypothetical protein